MRTADAVLMGADRRDGRRERAHKAAETAARGKQEDWHHASDLDRQGIGDAELEMLTAEEEEDRQLEVIISSVKSSRFNSGGGGSDRNEAKRNHLPAIGQRHR